MIDKKVKLPDQSKGTHTHRLQVGVSVAGLALQRVSELRRSGAEVPAGDLEGSAKDLGTYKLGHDEFGGRSRWGEREVKGRGRKRCTGENRDRQNNGMRMEQLDCCRSREMIGLPSVPNLV